MGVPRVDVFDAVHAHIDAHGTCSLYRRNALKQRCVDEYGGNHECAEATAHQAACRGTRREALALDRDNGAAANRAVRRQNRVHGNVGVVLEQHRTRAVVLVVRCHLERHAARYVRRCRALQQRLRDPARGNRRQIAEAARRAPVRFEALADGTHLGPD